MFLNLLMYILYFVIPIFGHKKNNPHPHNYDWDDDGDDRRSFSPTLFPTTSPTTSSPTLSPTLSPTTSPTISPSFSPSLWPIEYSSSGSNDIASIDIILPITIGSIVLILFAYYRLNKKQTTREDVIKNNTISFENNIAIENEYLEPVVTDELYEEFSTDDVKYDEAVETNEPVYYEATDNSS